MGNDGPGGNSPRGPDRRRADRGQPVSRRDARPLRMPNGRAACRSPVPTSTIDPLDDGRRPGRARMASRSASSFGREALRHAADRAVGLVGDPAGHAEVHAATQDVVAEPDALDPAACDRLEAVATDPRRRLMARSAAAVTRGRAGAARRAPGRRARAPATRCRDQDRAAPEPIEEARQVGGVETQPRPRRSRPAGRGHGPTGRGRAGTSARSRATSVHSADERLRCASALGGRRPGCRTGIVDGISAVVRRRSSVRGRGGGGRALGALPGGTAAPRRRPARSPTVAQRGGATGRRADAGQPFGGPRVEQVEERPAELVAGAQRIGLAAQASAMPGPAGRRPGRVGRRAAHRRRHVRRGSPRSRGCRRAPGASRAQRDRIVGRSGSSASAHRMRIDPGRRLLERLEQGRLGVLVHALGRLDDGDPGTTLDRQQGQLADEVADAADACAPGPPMPTWRPGPSGPNRCRSG